MSRVILAKSAGFCFGVSRSVELAEGQLALGPCKCLGPLIHNQDVVDRLAARGMAVISSPKLRTVLSGKDLNPWISSAFRYTHFTSFHTITNLV